MQEAQSGRGESLNVLAILLVVFDALVWIALAALLVRLIP
jgi:hypothetical protein